MTATKIHDSDTCTAGANGSKCEICLWAVERTQNPAPDPYSLFGSSNGSQRQETANLTVPSSLATPDFDREWREAPESRRRYTEQSEAQWWLMRGVWLGIQYERERGLLVINGDLREMQRIARERIGR